jgi:universal stress protein A
MTSKTAPSPIPKVILVPCDFSDCSRHALDYAAGLAKHSGGNLVLLHVIEPVQPGFLIEGTVSRQAQGRMRERATRELAAMMKLHAGGAHAGCALVKGGKPWEVIVSVASRIAADLIVIGTHGYTGLKHGLLGSVAERVVRHAPCPVLTVRTKTRTG